MPQDTYILDCDEDVAFMTGAEKLLVTWKPRPRPRTPSPIRKLFATPVKSEAGKKRSRKPSAPSPPAEPTSPTSPTSSASGSEVMAGKGGEHDEGKEEGGEQEEGQEKGEEETPKAEDDVTESESESSGDKTP
jgi:hypothetical protein